MSDRPKPDLRAMTDSLRMATNAFRRLGDAVRNTHRGTDRLAIADHPDLDTLNHEFNNLYGGGFS